jgi:polyvinyl alcohol dehydrogenase (cytochrome)
MARHTRVSLVGRIVAALSVAGSALVGAAETATPPSITVTREMLAEQSDATPSPGTSTPAAAVSSITDPATLFASRCAACHNLGVVPTLPQLSRLTAEQIEAALWQGVMQEPANGLDSGQRVLLAQWIAGLNPDKGVPGPGVTKCARPGEHWHPTPAVDWPGFSRDDTFQRYVADPGMTAKRVERTMLKWSLPLPMAGAAVDGGAGNPVAVVGNRVFVASFNHWVYALDAHSGCAEWTFRVEGRVRSNVAVENGVLIVGDMLANVYGLDARSGKLLWQRRVDSGPSVRITGNVTLHGGVAYIPVSSFQEVWSMRGDIPCCSFRGSMVALNASTGVEKWKTFTIDQPLRFLGKTATGVNRYGPSGVMVWSGISVDDERGVVYVTTGNQFTEPRVEESDAVMALDMHTGKKRWVAALAPEQMGGEDIYVMGCEDWVDPHRSTCSPANPKGQGDRDFGAPAAITRLADGTDLVLAGSKDGMFYALDPDTGKVKWKVRVGAGGEMGGVEYGFATDGRYAFVPVSDLAMDLTAKGSFSAIDLSTGKIAWRVEGPKDTCSGKPTQCSNAYLSIPTVAGDVVWVGNQDGVLRAYARADGRLVWSFDTTREFTGANGAAGRGGSIANGGPVIAGNRVYVMAGWGVLNMGMPGNTLLSFEVPQR